MVENMNDGYDWECPYCGLIQPLQINNNFKNDKVSITRTHKYEYVGKICSMKCVNSKCKEISLYYGLFKTTFLYEDFGELVDSSSVLIKSWRLLPDSIAKNQPNCIPKYIRTEYEKACKIVHDDPGASVVRSRRCIEGMLKDFCNIKENNIAKAIDKLKTKVRENKIPEVTEESIEEIDTIRKMGKIGAHIMKAGGDTIVEVSQGDAERVIKIIEYLFKDWYVARHNREKNQKDREQNSKGLQASLEKYNKKTANQKKDRKSRNTSEATRAATKQ